MSTAASPALRRLLEKRLDSFEKLEIVLALCDAPVNQLSIDQLARELQVGTDVLRRLVSTLATTGLVSVEAEAVTLAATPAELEIVDEARCIYQEDRSQIVTLFSSIALDRIRGMAARSFADAFKIGRKKGGDDG